MRPSLFRVCPNSSDQCPCKKDIEKKTDTETWWRRPYENEDRDWSDTAPNHGNPGVTRIWKKSRILL